MNIETLWNTWSIYRWIWFSESIRQSLSPLISSICWRNDTRERRDHWHSTREESVNFLDVPINNGSWLDEIQKLWLEPRMLWNFETWTVSAMILFWSICPHNDRDSLWYSNLRTLLIPLKFPDWGIKFWTGSRDSSQFEVDVFTWDAIMFDQNYPHHARFDARERLATALTVFVTRESFERVLNQWVTA